jgi:nucleoside-diphosphate-sugar epimerase
MTILITGAGLIATHSAVSLIDRGEDVVFYDVAPDQTYIDLVLEGRQYALVKGDILDLAHLLEVAKQHNARASSTPQPSCRARRRPNRHSPHGSMLRAR